MAVVEYFANTYSEARAKFLAAARAAGVCTFTTLSVYHMRINCPPEITLHHLQLVGKPGPTSPLSLFYSKILFEVDQTNRQAETQGSTIEI
jgi:hypothetical protein